MELPALPHPPDRQPRGLLSRRRFFEAPQEDFHLLGGLQIPLGFGHPDALEESPRLRFLSGYALVGSGEEAGRTAEMLLRWAARLDDQASEQRDLWSLWLPRLLYAVVAAWMAYGLLAGSARLLHS